MFTWWHEHTDWWFREEHRWTDEPSWGGRTRKVMRTIGLFALKILTDTFIEDFKKWCTCNSYYKCGCNWVFQCIPVIIIISAGFFFHFPRVFFNQYFCMTWLKSLQVLFCKLGLIVSTVVNNVNRYNNCFDSLYIFVVSQVFVINLFVCDCLIYLPSQ